MFPARRSAGPLRLTENLARREDWEERRPPFFYVHGSISAGDPVPGSAHPIGTHVLRPPRAPTSTSPYAVDLRQSRPALRGGRRAAGDLSVSAPRHGRLPTRRRNKIGGKGSLTSERVRLALDDPPSGSSPGRGARPGRLTTRCSETRSSFPRPRPAREGRPERAVSSAAGRGQRSRRERRTGASQS